MDERLYLLKITLLGIEPKVWRMFVVPASISLDRFHDVIQIVMGWNDSHLHEFAIGKKCYTEEPERGDGTAEEGFQRLVDLVKRRGRSFLYLYDFGDGWEHEVELEESRYNGKELPSVIWCLEGEGACPPEDVGGVPGYEEFRMIMADPDHPDHKAMGYWYSGYDPCNEGFDPDRFVVERANEELGKFERWSRDRIQFW